MDVGSPSGGAAASVFVVFIAFIGQPAVLQSIYIDIGFLFSVNYALIRGIRIPDGKPIQEKLVREGALDGAHSPRHKRRFQKPRSQPIRRVPSVPGAVAPPRSATGPRGRRSESGARFRR